MNILLVSQCSKNALTETRRVIDQFAERCGDRTWQTAITQQGLDTLRKLLKKSARRNTAVACHWIRSKNHTELLWIVGNQRKFNAEGATPTNSTSRNILRADDENSGQFTQVIALLAGIAGLFHDFGKANLLFQRKIDPSIKTPAFEVYRHEWVSLRLFQAFAADKTDQQWLTELSQISVAREQSMLARLQQDGSSVCCQPPFAGLTPLAATVAWLIVSHHRLPVSDPRAQQKPQISEAEFWLERQFTAEWNSTCTNNNWTETERQQNWLFAQGTPFRSKSWQAKAQQLAKRALLSPRLFEAENFLQQRFVSHLARLSLMLADHYYSSLEPTEKWWDPTYLAFANSYREKSRVSGKAKGALKQRLDEHNIGVGHHAYLLARALPTLRQQLPAITRHKGLKKRTENLSFRWQDKAYDAACGARERSVQQGFFGINMASTGKGKTLANCRIMYGLANEKSGCRFSVALGLRTLTLQTGDALKRQLNLLDEDIAVLTGSSAVQQLHSMNQQALLAEQKTSTDRGGSESLADEMAEHLYVNYQGALYDGPLKDWLNSSPKLNQLVSAPVLITTIDHLMPATEGVRGGKQIAPMLRLLTADLVLDEPDDFDTADYPALCRLVNWCGMLGGRVLLSSATLPPVLVAALFDAYRSGREYFNQANVAGRNQLPVCCSWFDEFAVQSADCLNKAELQKQHTAFVQARAKQLSVEPALRKAAFLTLRSTDNSAAACISAMAATIQTGLLQLHATHQNIAPSGQKVSLGLVRMANINPLVAVAKQLMSLQVPANHRIHFCVYHSQYPLAVRSVIEQKLDAALTRHKAETLWQQPEIKQALEKHPEQNHLFVVLATAVAEVGRDHDYDWAIAEPSSMRSLIQLAGRIQRHRQEPPTSENLLILSSNFKALKAARDKNGNLLPAYCNPGFEHEHLRLRSHDLEDILQPAQYQQISALPRISPPPMLPSKVAQQAAENLVWLEHFSMWQRLFIKPGVKEFGHVFWPEDVADTWWQQHLSWCGELQKRTPFRQSTPDEGYCFVCTDDEEILFCRVNDYIWPAEYPEAENISADDWSPSPPNQFWLDLNIHCVYQQLAERLDLSPEQVSYRYGEIRLRLNQHPVQWLYHPMLGVFSALD